jgi:hypothetical protein
MKRKKLHPLRKLAADLERLALKNKEFSVVAPIIANACDHICAIAHIHELHAKEEQ